MLFKTSVATSLLIATQFAQSSAQSFHRAREIVHGIHPRSNELHLNVLRHIDNAIEDLDRRQDAAPSGSPTSSGTTAPNPSTTPQSGDASTINLEEWDAKTSVACSNALRALEGQASNPSGIAVCYNLPFLDNSTGVFEAELRVYNISAPIGPWIGVAVEDITVGLSYPGATVQNTNGTFMKKRATPQTPTPPMKFSIGNLEGRQTATDNMPELKVLTYVGKVNDNLMGTAMNAAQLQPLLVPSIKLATTNPGTNEQIETTLSSTEASFVSGVFEDEANSATNAAAAAASASAAAAAATPFQLPGTTLGIFPTGMIVTLIWTVTFIVVVGLGTLGRIQFRDSYRQRVKRDLALTTRTI
ncbi:hypothetical protein M501DRAFT_925330 [Patellaria atrata CBS 101060]|uniref:Uncharacterized protein n=1 Tax=Patellaria atrata CBS 101060 TaxID=1346257 RepID=A0A9P4SH73_9PEZI|nr:hypothetical protein M501DRAFT_925330 [Patellaria atrata CBS 101060]